MLTKVGLLFSVLILSCLGILTLFAQVNPQLVSAEDADSNTQVEVDGEINLSGNCSYGAGPLAWILCPVFSAITSVLTFLEDNIIGTCSPDQEGGCSGRVLPTLRVDRNDYDRQFRDTASGEIFSYHEAWKSIRSFMTIFIVGTALFMVISTALDVGIFSNYTVKKYLPRLVIGTILIQLSWILGDLFIYFINSMGDLLSAILYQAFPGASDFGLANIINNANWLEELVIAGGVVYAAMVILIPVLSTLAIGLLVTWLFLEIRQYVIILLLVISPLGLTFWILPGNDKAWRFYAKLFLYLVMMYPIVAMIIAAAKIFSYLIILSG